MTTSTLARCLFIRFAAAALGAGCATSESPTETQPDPAGGGSGSSSARGGQGGGVGGVSGGSSGPGDGGAGGVAGAGNVGAAGGVGAPGGTVGTAGATGGVSGGAGRGGMAPSGQMGLGGSAGTSTGAGGTGGAGGTVGAGGAAGAVAGTFPLYDHIPMYGMYATTNPSFVPPAGVVMWSFGTAFVIKLNTAQQARIGADLAARITYHAQCDNYDRIGGVFFLLKPRGEAPKATDPRTELVRFITPFSDYNRGALATRVYPDADISAYARTLADPSRDVWIGIGGGSNPYDGDPCTNAGVAPDFRSVGYKYSLDFVSTKPLTPGPGTTLTAVANVSATKVPVAGAFNNAGAGELTGTITVIVSAHGAESGGHEYRNTQDTVTLNGKQLGSFSTMVDCAALERYSPDGNPGIFRNNNGNNPRNWCPGALVPSHTFPATLVAGSNSVSLGVNVSSVPAGSYYATSITFSSL